MRAIIVGAGGQLGIELAAEAERRGHNTLALGRRQLDITRAKAVDAVFDRHRPEIVFNAAAYNFVDLAEKEPERAIEANGFAVRNLAIACRRLGATLVHYSTDHVFDGSKEEPYTEQDLPSPPSAYGVSKLAGELFAAAYVEQRYVIRVAGVFGPAGRKTTRGNFPETVLGKAEAGEPLRVVDDFFATPTYAPALAARTFDLTETGAFGLYHIGGGETISWYEWALKILKAAGREADILPTNRTAHATPARRPLHAGLSNAKIEALGIARMPPLDESLKEYLRRREEDAAGEG